jgi:hypothetical protein
MIRFCPSLNPHVKVVMKPAKPFVVEIKRNGRRRVVRDQEPFWDPKLLQSATKAVEDAREASGSRPETASD